MSQNAGSYNASGSAVHVLIKNVRPHSRVNIIGVIVVSQERQMMVDDGTGQIIVRGAQCLYVTGTVVVVIGLAHAVNGKQFVIADIVCEREREWLHVRRNELSEPLHRPLRQLLHKHKNSQNKSPIPMKMEDHEFGVVSVIKDLDSGRGVAIDDVIAKGTSEQELHKLIQQGEIFEISPGVVKVLE